MARRIARLAVVGAGLLAIATIVRTSLDPDTYFYYRDQDRTTWEYPTGGVAFVVMAALLETAVAYAVLAVRGPGRIWTRAFVGLAILAPWGWWVSEFVVHAPGYWLTHLLWVWLVILALGVAATASVAYHAYSLLRGRTL